MANLFLLASLAGASGVSGLASAGVSTPTVWAEYSFENSLADVSGNGRDLSVGSGSSSRWSPVFVAGQVGQAVHLDSSSGPYADSSNSWLQGPVVSGADVGSYFEMSFHIALLDKGYLHGENILTFQATGDTTDLASLLWVTAGANERSELHFLGQTILSAGGVYNGAWHTVKLSSSNPCDASPTWDLVFDGTSYTSGPYGGASICGRQPLMNRHCWSGGLSCASRVNMKVDEMVIRSAEARLVRASASNAAAVGDPHLQNIHGERFDLMKAGKHVLINIPRGTSADNSFLRVQAVANRLGGHCADMYFQELNVTGSWAEAKQPGGYHYSVLQPEIKTAEWIALYTVELKVVHGLTDGGLRYLNLYVKHLGRAGFAVGGLLGEDDHGDVITPPEACARRTSLVADVVEDAVREAPAVLSVAEASLA